MAEEKKVTATIIKFPIATERLVGKISDDVFLAAKFNAWFDRYEGVIFDAAEKD